ncbi:hypothetical protein EVAR_88939_1 [Eumeta japonica]|uniref:Uncharacterized protein n=1 Tax=Eumeta variegata TaxID=151549 RepID=A0A4C1VP45_EUMVA|nr:hypothetical protein EVAR_88939_1 [Eumeta japonica]
MKFRKKRRGVRNTEKYKHVVVKTAKIKGLPRVNHRGKDLPGRRTEETCRCPQKCFDGLSEDDKSGLIEQINSFGTKDEQDIYLQSMIELFTPIHLKAGQ